MSPLALVTLVAAIISALCWFLSLVTKETSWVDRIWSIAPELYLWLFAGRAHWHSVTLNVMAVLATLWGARLTFNFARKGGYSGMEDYRWAVLRASMTRWQFQLFNFFFIVLYQNLLLVLITLPAYSVLQHQGRPTSAWIWALGALFLVLLTGEFVADEQQWRFHQRKHAAQAAGTPTTPGFLTTGLFRYARHPNYFFEIAQWWVIYLFSVAATGQWLSVTIIGAVLLSVLFIGSTRFTEQISSQKYPEYADYQRRTSPIIPWISKR